MIEESKRLRGLDLFIERMKTTPQAMQDYRNLTPQEKLLRLESLLPKPTTALGAGPEECSVSSPVLEPSGLSSPDPLSKGPWPPVFRLTGFRYQQADERRCECVATLFHERASMQVRWTARQPDLRLKAATALVRVHWTKSATVSTNGCIRVDRIVRLERPEHEVNLFETIPRAWVRDRSLVRQGIELMNSMPSELRRLFNGIFWDGERFKRFCNSPSSLHHHHARENGNLVHSLEVALGIRRELGQPVLGDEGPSRSGANWTTSDFDFSIDVMAGLLHDAGKADEYRVMQDGNYGLTTRGRMLGHKTTVVEWIAVAQAKWPTGLRERDYIRLIHNLTSAKGAPEWLGIRRPETLGAALLTGLDRLSGARDQMR